MFQLILFLFFEGGFIYFSKATRIFNVILVRSCTSKPLTIYSEQFSGNIIENCYLQDSVGPNHLNLI